jgi:glycosyltransferase involved in cell wall biosynthesis
MPKKKVLIFIDWFTPGFRAGGPITSCVNLVDHLKDEIDFSVITSDTDYMETAPYPGIASDQWITRADGVRVYYFSKANLTRAAMKRLIEREKFDYAYLNGMFSRNFTLMPLKVLKKMGKGRLVLAVRGMLAPSALRIKAAKKQFFLSYAKLSGLYKGVLFQATNQQELSDIFAVFGKTADVKIAFNLPERSVRAPYLKRDKQPGRLNLVNIARIAPEKNLLYALEVLQKVKADINFDFYGPVYDEGYWKQCQEQLARLPGNIKAAYRGILQPGRVAEVLAGYHYMFMPTRGENFGHVILQSWSAGTPVIISDQTPWPDLQRMGCGYGLPLNDPLGFAEAIEECAGLDQLGFDDRSRSAYDYVTSRDQELEKLKDGTRQLFS